MTILYYDVLWFLKITFFSSLIHFFDFPCQLFPEFPALQYCATLLCLAFSVDHSTRDHEGVSKLPMVWVMRVSMNWDVQSEINQKETGRQDKLEFSKFHSWSWYVWKPNFKSLASDFSFRPLSFDFVLCLERINISSILIRMTEVGSTSDLLCELVTCLFVDIWAKMTFYPLLAVFFLLVTVYANYGKLTFCTRYLFYLFNKRHKGPGGVWHQWHVSTLIYVKI